MQDEVTVPAPPDAAPPEEDVAALRRERDELAAERDRIQGELDRLKRGECVRELADRAGFTDPDYLDYLLDRHDLSPDAPEVGEFMTELKSRSPKLFRVELHAGAPVPGPQVVPAAGLPDRHADLMRRLETAPELN